MVSIILSGMPASGKSTVAQLISKSLGIRFLVGGDILKAMAKSLGFNPERDNWWDTEEGKRFLELRMKDPNFDKNVDNFLLNSIKKENCVITSWSIPWLIDNNHLKIWLKASFKTRVRRLAQRDNVNYNDAEKIIKDRDEINVKHYEKLYGYILGRDLDVFNLIVDVDSVKAETVAEMLILYYNDFKSNVKNS
ncbi:MAG: cytidylate kinase family protein [Conexivisphaerales archaeon]